jgi:hypothetical protein
MLKTDNKTKEKTTNCEKRFACLSNQGHKLCEVEYFYNDKVLFIKCLSKDHCSYKMSFGTSSFVCNCPSRIEIYKKQGI